MTTDEGWEEAHQGSGVQDRYPWVQAWGRMMQHSEGQILETLLMADKDHAPPTAVFQYESASGEPKWAILEDVLGTETRLWMVDWSDSFSVPMPHSVLRAWLTPNRSAVLRQLPGI